MLIPLNQRVSCWKSINQPLATTFKNKKQTKHNRDLRVFKSGIQSVTLIDRIPNSNKRKQKQGMSHFRVISSETRELKNEEH